MIAQRIDRVSRECVFGEAASIAGLAGSSRAGWTCPRCAAPNGLAERPDRAGARCRSCNTGYDRIGVVMAGRGLSFLDALARIERFISSRDAPPAHARDLFDIGGAS